MGMTDSRLRPDQKLMEEGRWDEANSEKQRLEEKQRAVRRRREAEASDALDDGRKTVMQGSRQRQASRRKEEWKIGSRVVWWGFFVVDGQK